MAGRGAARRRFGVLIEEGPKTLPGMLRRVYSAHCPEVLSKVNQGNPDVDQVIGRKPESRETEEGWTWETQKEPRVNCFYADV